MTTPPVLPGSTCPLLIRTAFDDEPAWAATVEAVEAVEAVATPSEGDGFLAVVEVVDAEAYRDLPPERLRALLPAGEYVTVFFVADARAIGDPAHPLLVVPVPQDRSPFLDEPPREAFRVVVAELWSVENNLSLANLDWDDFAGSVDDDGVFRGI